MNLLHRLLDRLALWRGALNFLGRALPRPLFVTAAEISGLASIQNSGNGLRGALARLRPLLRHKHGLIHPLFDQNYYLQTNPDLAGSRWPPLLHFLLWGAAENRQPHPLFDPRWYCSLYPDVAATRLNPLQHYVHFGWRENRSPHPLFDPTWYLSAYPDVKEANCNPLVHFLLWGGAEGRRPHPLFDTPAYVGSSRAVRDSGWNPLVHYVLVGAKSGLNPNVQFDTAKYIQCNPTLLDSNTDPLTHYLTSAGPRTYDPHPGYVNPFNSTHKRPLRSSCHVLTLGSSGAAAPTAPLWHNSLDSAEIQVFIVYGQPNVAFIESNLIPALAAQRCRRPLRVHTLHYRSSFVLLSPTTLAFAGGAVKSVTDWSAGRESRHIGFGESINYLFERVAPSSCFLILNPDALPMQGCLEQLLCTFETRGAALVEARQWPSEHPKEFDPATGWTPWASGAFLLISSAAFQRLNGFDPLYFLYNEDVDLSWRAWLSGMPVVYERAALCAHFTGLLHYRPNRFYYEQFFSIRNFLVIAYKFFGERGERAAWEWIDQARLPAAFYDAVRSSYLGIRHRIQRIPPTEASPYGDMVKIIGLNRYHELRSV